MNKILLKTFLTVICSIIIFTVIDFCAYTIDWFEIKKLHDKYGTWLIPYKYSWVLDSDPYSYIISKSSFRPPVNTQSKKEAVYIFGCSFAYGESLQENKTFASQIAKLTNRPVYNFAFPGFSIQHTLYQLENMDFSEYPPPKYVIYIYIDDHIRRMLTDFMQPHELNMYPIYKPDKNGNLVFQNKSRITPSIFYIVKKLQCTYAKYKADSPHYAKENAVLMEKHFLKANELIKELFPDAKFVVLLYQPKNFQDKEVIKELEENGITVISTDNLSSENLSEKKYKLIDSHPSEKVWQLLTKPFLQMADIN